jgi:hypothetical protein
MLKLYFCRTLECVPVKLSEAFIFLFCLKLWVFFGGGWRDFPTSLPFCLASDIRVCCFFYKCKVQYLLISPGLLFTVALLCLSKSPTSPCSHMLDVFLQICGDTGKGWVSLIGNLANPVWYFFLVIKF